MHFKKMAMGLIVAGVLGLIVGMFMDTTVATGHDSSMRVYNIGLQSRQQNILIISGILFLGGIILFAAAKLKSTEEDEQAEEAAKEQARASRKAALEASAEKARDTADLAAGFLRHQFSRDFLRQPFAFNDHPDRRLAVGILVGLSLGLLGHQALPWWLIAIGCIAYAFLNANSRALQRHLLILHTAVYTLGFLLIAGSVMADQSMWAMALIPAVPMLVSGIWLFSIRERAE